MVNKKKVGNDIILAAEVAASLFSIYILWRIVKGPDASRTLRMRLALSAEKFCVSEAQFWASMADKAETVYRNSTLVTS